MEGFLRCGRSSLFSVAAVPQRQAAVPSAGGPIAAGTVPRAALPPAGRHNLDVPPGAAPRPSHHAGRGRRPQARRLAAIQAKNQRRDQRVPMAVAGSPLTESPAAPPPEGSPPGTAMSGGGGRGREEHREMTVNRLFSAGNTDSRGNNGRLGSALLISYCIVSSISGM